MTRKDYILIAKVLSNIAEDFNNGGEDTVSLSLVVEELASTFADDNPRFNRERFLATALMTSAKREAILNQIN